jgi:hypothetical protein
MSGREQAARYAKFGGICLHNRQKDVIVLRLLINRAAEAAKSTFIEVAHSLLRGLPD